ncbi:hypothetical protein BpHYR1_008981 [Brachionus plicatilis]|uniref:Uncharacterized protein n=1 Tax=Brachionus plicatilis TaxID=10195 RepID=A0A3M7RKX7_BRAPC|nr:hypothetical protein BpHYR1_008981 [Brachionus plicatilis]
MDDGNRLEEIQRIENVDFGLKALFTAKLCEKFKKDINKNDFDSIEKTRITQKQIDYLIEMLETKKTKAKGIKMTSYKALFGCEMYSGSELFNLPGEEKTKIKTAKQLLTLPGRHDDAELEIDDDHDNDSYCDDVVSNELLKIQPETECQDDEENFDDLVKQRSKKIKVTRSNVKDEGDLVLFRTDDVDRSCRAGVLDTFVKCNCIEKTNLVTEFNQEFIPKDK